MMDAMLERGLGYDEMRRKFQWDIPEKFNVADAVCDRWAEDPARVALLYEDAGKRVHKYTYGDIRRHANRLANTLLRVGLGRGDRVSVLLAQEPEAAITHVACWKAGMVSGPCSVLLGDDAIAYRLNDSGARALVTDSANYPKVAAIRAQCPTLEHVLVTDGAPDGAENFWDAIEGGSETFRNVDTDAEDVAWISYTSGTTGMPKGAVQPHRIMIGHVPSLEFLYDVHPDSGDTLWSPADWAWMAGLTNILLCAWFHGCTVVSTAMKGFDAEEAFRILAEYKVTRSILTPTMLKLMRDVPDPMSRHTLSLRGIVSGSEAVGASLIEWVKETFGLDVHEGYGQTECNLMLGNNTAVFPPRIGSLGKPTPGSTVAIVDDAGREVPPGTEGHIACKRPDPVMFLEYLNNPEATRNKFVGDWLITGDLGHMDEDGYFWFHGRSDDLITSAGYRIGPGEIEDALMKHAAVQMAAAIGVPDPVRTEIIKAFVVPREGIEPNDALAEELREFVRAHLAKYEVPRMIEFVDGLPMTTTGKVMRRALREREKEPM